MGTAAPGCSALCLAGTAQDLEAAVRCFGVRPTVWAAAMMLTANLIFAGLNTNCHLLYLQQGVTAAQMMFFSTATTCPIFLLLLLIGGSGDHQPVQAGADSHEAGERPKPATRPLDWLLGRQRWLLALKAFLTELSVFAAIYANTVVPPGEATAIMFSSIVLTTIFATVFLGEAVRCSGVIACAGALTGVIFVARPAGLFGPTPAAIDTVAGNASNENIGDGAGYGYGYGPVTPTYASDGKDRMLGVVSAAAFACLWATAAILSRKLRDEHTLVLLWGAEALGLLLSACLLCSCAGGQGCGPDLAQLWNADPVAVIRLVVVPGPLTCLGLWLVSLSFQLAPAGPLMTVSSAEVVFAFAFQLAFVHVQPYSEAYVGAALIVGSTVVLLLSPPDGNEMSAVRQEIRPSDVVSRRSTVSDRAQG
eukprot:SAG31_NODE_728_length_12522_cov_13.320534_13_plen_421_part_00